MIGPGTNPSSRPSPSGEGEVSSRADVVSNTSMAENLKNAQIRVRDGENALSQLVLERDSLVRQALEGGMSKRAIGRALGIDHRAVYGLLQRTAPKNSTAVTDEGLDLVLKRRQTQAAVSWLSIATRQTEQAESAEVDGMVDGMLAILALHVAASCAIRGLGESHLAVERFLGDKQIGHEPLKNSRDLLAHFDAYVAGDGNLQRAEIDGQRRPNPEDARPPLLPMWGGGQGQQLTFLTKTWVRGENGQTLLRNGEPLRQQGLPCMESLEISIDLRDSLRATAALIGECCELAGVSDRGVVRDLLARASRQAD